MRKKLLTLIVLGLLALAGSTAYTFVEPHIPAYKAKIERFVLTALGEGYEDRKSTLAELGNHVLREEPCTTTLEQGSSIQDAIDSAPAQAVICLPEGKWEEHLTIGKSLTLRGMGAENTEIEAVRSDIPAIQVWSWTQKTVRFSKLSLAGAYKTDIGEGIEVGGNAALSVNDVTIADFRTGVKLADLSTGLIAGSVIRSNNMGVKTKPFSMAKIANSELIENELGGVRTEAEELVISNSTISDNESTGVMVNWSPVEIDGSELTNNGGAGIYVASGGNTQTSIKNSVISGNEGWGIHNSPFYPEKCDNSENKQLAGRVGNILLVDNDISDNTPGSLCTNDPE